MRVVIETSAFAHPENTGTLVALFNLGLDLRHRIQVSDDQAPELKAWLDDLRPQELHDECRLALDLGFEQESREPSRHEVRVTVNQPTDLSGPAPRLSLHDALPFLRRPFRVVVEDQANDAAFLLCMCSEQQRTFIQDRLQKGSLEIEHGGGLPVIERRIAALQLQDGAHLTTFILFDSDALRPSVPSAQSEKVRRACEGGRLHHYQLGRRAIENYLPKRSLSGWIDLGAGREDRMLRRARVEAFFELGRPEQRHHFNLKRGFAGDRGRAATGETAGALYDDVAEDVRRTLENGVGRTLAEELFTPPGMKVMEVDFRADGGWSELNPVVSALIALMR